MQPTDLIRPDAHSSYRTRYGATRLALAAFSVLPLMVAASGCAQNGAEFVAVRCVPQAGPQRVEAFSFQAVADVRGYEGQQVVYKVEVVDYRGQPIRSGDTRYATTDGNVAASRSYLVADTPQRLDRLRVSIPVDELELEQNHLPAGARFTVADAAGQVLATAYCQVPIRTEREIRPPMDEDAAEPEPRELWFVRPGKDDRWPIFRGPYETPVQLREAEGTDKIRTVRLSDADYFWFVPLRLRREPQETRFVGPCVHEDAAQQIADTLSGKRGHREIQAVDPPVRLRLRTAMPRRVRLARPKTRRPVGPPPPDSRQP